MEKHEIKEAKEYLEWVKGREQTTTEKALVEMAQELIIELEQSHMRIDNFTQALRGQAIKISSIISGQKPGKEEG